MREIAIIETLGRRWRRRHADGPVRTGTANRNPVRVQPESQSKTAFLLATPPHMVRITAACIRTGHWNGWIAFF